MLQTSPTLNTGPLAAPRKKSRSKEAREECENILKKWRNTAWHLYHSDSAWGPNTLLSDKLLSKLAEDSSVKTTQDLRLHPQLSAWTWIDEYGVEALEQLEPVDVHYNLERERQQRQKEIEKKRKAEERREKKREEREEIKKKNEEAKARRRAEETEAVRVKVEAMRATYDAGMRAAEEQRQRTRTINQQQEMAWYHELKHKRRDQVAVDRQQYWQQQRYNVGSLHYGYQTAMQGM
jgi:hypothetical protein